MTKSLSKTTGSLFEGEVERAPLSQRERDIDRLEWEIKRIEQTAAQLAAFGRDTLAGRGIPLCKEMQLQNEVTKRKLAIKDLVRKRK